MLDSEPLISIVTPTYNSELLLAATIESVIDQTYSNWELIIVDDASTDRTMDIINQYARHDSRIKVVELRKNSGAGIARNTAIDLAKGRFLAFLDSDDLWFPAKLEKQVAFMLEKDIAFSFTGYTRIQEDGLETGAIMHAPDLVDYDNLMKHCVIGCLTVMLDLDKTGKMKMRDLRNRQDYVLWLELTKKGFIAHGYPEILAKYRLVNHSISSNKLKMAKLNWGVYRKIERQNIFKASWYFSHYIWYYIKRKIDYTNSKRQLMKHRRCQGNYDGIYQPNIEKKRPPVLLSEVRAKGRK